MYQLTEETAELLDRVRGKLEGDLQELYVGGTAAGADAEPGDGGADHNPTDVADSFDMYLDTILERLVNETGMDDSAGASYIMRMAGQLAGEGDLPPWPGEGSDDEVAIWLGKAKTIGFEYYVLRQAHTGS